MYSAAIFFSSAILFQGHNAIFTIFTPDKVHHRKQVHYIPFFFLQETYTKFHVYQRILLMRCLCLPSIMQQKQGSKFKFPVCHPQHSYIYTVSLLTIGRLCISLQVPPPYGLIDRKTALHILADVDPVGLSINLHGRKNYTHPFPSARHSWQRQLNTLHHLHPVWESYQQPSNATPRRLRRTEVNHMLLT